MAGQEEKCEDEIVHLRDKLTKEPASGHASLSIAISNNDTDSTLSWTAAEERRVVRKTDFRLLLAFCAMYLVIQMDRANLSNALTDNFLADLNMTSSDYNNGLTISVVTFLVSEFPVQCLILHYSFRDVFPWMIMAWGFASAAQGFINNRPVFYALRAIIGFLEGGFVPGVVYFFTQFYTTSELSPRLAILTSVSDLSLGVASLLAAGVLRMRGVLGRSGWFWLFMTEGILVLLTGILSYAYLPRAPDKTTSFFCRKPWYSDRELAILEKRLVNDDASKAQNGKRVKVSFKTILTTFRDTHLWGLFVLGILAVMFSLPMKAYLHLTLRRLGFSLFKSNVLAVPSAILQLVSVLGLSLSSEHFHERTWHCVFAAFWSLPCFIGLVALTPSDQNASMSSSGAWKRYALATLIAGSPSLYPILLSWVSALSCTVVTRGVNVASVSTLALVGAVLSTQLYAENDEPFYAKGNKAEIALASLACAVLVGQRIVFGRLNRIRGQESQIEDPGQGQEVQRQESEPPSDHELRRAPGYKFPV